MGDRARARIGTRDQFKRLPARVEVGTRPFFLIHDGSRYRLLSAICPHQSGVVFEDGDRFACPIHNWQFALDGRCLTAPSRPLQSHDVVVEDDVLFVELSQAASAALGQRGRLRPPGLSLSLHGHACLEIAWRGFSVVTDPWLDGPAMLGAWAPYPPPLISGAALRPNALVVTHEHSDHFHAPTLRHIDPDVPVLVPAFPNGRLERQLNALGFRNVRSLRFGERTELAPGWAVTAYEPDSFWNDALVLFEVGGFRILDINDAGINARLAGAIDSVDLLAIQFSAGASGYPWTWAHIEDAQKEAISQRTCAGTLSLVREAACIYQASYVLPFASHFTLWYPDHRVYARQMCRNCPADVVAAFAGTPVRVLDLLPGDAWVSDGDRIERRRDPEALYAPGAIARPMPGRRSHRQQFAAAYLSATSLTRADLVHYFERLNEVPDIVHCEDLSVRFIASAPEGDIGVDFEVVRRLPPHPGCTARPSESRRSRFPSQSPRPPSCTASPGTRRSSAVGRGSTGARTCTTRASGACCRHLTSGAPRAWGRVNAVRRSGARRPSQTCSSGTAPMPTAFCAATAFTAAAVITRRPILSSRPHGNTGSGSRGSSNCSPSCAVRSRQLDAPPPSVHDPHRTRHYPVRACPPATKAGAPMRPSTTGRTPARWAAATSGSGGSSPPRPAAGCSNSEAARAG